MKILGIDNGLDGGFVLLDGNAPVERIVMPTVNAKGSKREHDLANMARLIQSLRPDHAVIERAQAMPRQGVTSMFSYGHGYGLVRGVLAALGIPHTIVHPRTWQRALFRDLPKDDTKATAYLVCSRLWPTVDWRATPRSKKAHKGLVDAALIAEYGRRTLGATLPVESGNGGREA